jgi:hypothetical protein
MNSLCVTAHPFRLDLADPFLEGAADCEGDEMKPSDVLNLLGLNTTILRIAPGEKRPIAKEWQKLRPSDMTPDYLASFAAGEGIRVSLDEASWSAGSTTPNASRRGAKGARSQGGLGGKGESAKNRCYLLGSGAGSARKPDEQASGAGKPTSCILLR